MSPILNLKKIKTNNKQIKIKYFVGGLINGWLNIAICMVYIAIVSELVLHKVQGMYTNLFHQTDVYIEQCMKCQGFISIVALLLMVFD